MPEVKLDIKVFIDRLKDVAYQTAAEVYIQEFRCYIGIGVGADEARSRAWKAARELLDNYLIKTGV